ncbi:MAG: 50S ribosomal protein L6 [Spirochaetales bacterium]|nr:50S ribosomal protein L6 [Spirochaetales bacterium]
MSRLIKKPIIIPSNVKLSIQNDGNFYKIEAKGPKGTITKSIRNDIEIKQNGSNLTFAYNGNDNSKKPMLGTSYRIISSMIEGVVNGYSKTLTLFGVGYKATLKGKNIEFEIGLSHPVVFPLPSNVDVKIEQTKLTFSSCDKEILGLTVQKIRDLKKPDVYRGKGFRFEGENPIRKTGKKTAAK